MGGILEVFQRPDFLIQLLAHVELSVGAFPRPPAAGEEGLGHGRHPRGLSAPGLPYPAPRARRALGGGAPDRGSHSATGGARRAPRPPSPRPLLPAASRWLRS